MHTLSRSARRRPRAARASTPLIALLPIALFSATAPAQTTAPEPRPPQIRLVVQLTVDQMRGDYLDRFKSQYTGGLKWLNEHGAFFTNATHDHGATETAPGHATLWSGRYPAHHGIVRNEAGVQDPQAPLLLGSRGGGASPYRFRGSALFDWIRSDNQWSQALSVSRKDRGAILPLGRAHQNVYWYGLDGNFTTSKYYRDTMPTWVNQFNARNITEAYLSKPWELLLPASEYTEPDSVDAENSGKDFVFPHKFDENKSRALQGFVEFPYMDEITTAFALNGLNELKLGLGNGTDVLAVSLSTTDAVGHRYGPDSRELHDQLLRLDRALGKFLDSLFVLRDPSTVILALSADHGVTPLPALHFPGTDPMRGKVNIRSLMDTARSSLISLGLEGDVIDFESGMVVLEEKRLRAKGVNVDSVVRSLRTKIAKLPGIQSVYRREELPALAAKGNVIARRWMNAIPANLDVALTVSLKPYYYWSTVAIATHGTPNQLDAWVPIVFAGPAFKPGRYARDAHTVDIAPTMAAALGIEPIEKVDGKVLKEALRNAESAPAQAANKPAGKK
ncbi:MAG: alkaline phosphatase family protein [Gemmatimonas sp.]